MHLYKPKERNLKSEKSQPVPACTVLITSISDFHYFILVLCLNVFVLLPSPHVCEWFLGVSCRRAVRSLCLTWLLPGQLPAPACCQDIGHVCSELLGSLFHPARVDYKVHGYSPGFLWAIFRRPYEKISAKALWPHRLLTGRVQFHGYTSFLQCLFLNSSSLHKQIHTQRKTRLRIANLWTSSHNL